MSELPAMLPNPAGSIEVEPAVVARWYALPPGERPVLLDCRERAEEFICAIPGHRIIPLAELPLRWNELANAAERGVVVYCHHGVRSLRAAMMLRQKGIAGAFSMRGGIEAWSLEVDGSVPRY